MIIHLSILNSRYNHCLIFYQLLNYILNQLILFYNFDKQILSFQIYDYNFFVSVYTFKITPIDGKIPKITGLKVKQPDIVPEVTKRADVILHTNFILLKH